MGPKLQVTKNYDMFELCEFNRDVKNTKALRASMLEFGFIPAYPLHVVRNGGVKLKIKAGHHRLTVAKELGIPVFYIVCEDTATIHQLETPTGTWSVHDYLESYVRCGLAPYIAVKDFMDRTGICLQHSIAMLGGHTAGSNNFKAAFKSGTYKTGDTTHAEQVGAIVVALSGVNRAVAVNSLFVHALSRIVRVQQFDSLTFVHRCQLNPGMVQKQPNLSAYSNMIELVYNWHSQSKVPLVFLADELARVRSATFAKHSVEAAAIENAAG
jgi:hypothetical protein